MTGFPFPVGGARVWRVVPGEEPTVYATGFTNISDLTFDRRGRLYVLEMFHNGMLTAEEDSSGALIKVGRDGSKQIVTTDLMAPSGLVIAGNRAYVTNKSVLAGAGEVVRITL